MHITALFAIAACLIPAIAALSLVFAPTPLAAGEKLIVEAGAQISAGRNFVPRSYYKVVFVGAAASASPANILAAYTAIFGALVAGKKIFLRARVIGGNGLASAPLVTSKIIT